MCDLLPLHACMCLLPTNTHTLPITVTLPVLLPLQRPRRHVAASSTLLQLGVLCIMLYWQYWLLAQCLAVLLLPAAMPELCSMMQSVLCRRCASTLGGGEHRRAKRSADARHRQKASRKDRRLRADAEQPDESACACDPGEVAFEERAKETITAVCIE